jgi:UDP-N-acetylmuramoyl-L-alanyl-D-glutamate--2,6-diaminopimelate ligase
MAMREFPFPSTAGKSASTPAEATPTGETDEKIKGSRGSTIRTGDPVLLERLLQGVDVLRLSGRTDLDISGISYDSRSVGPGSLFVAMEGHAQDGHDFIDQAIQQAAAAVVAEKVPHGQGNATFIQVPDSRQALSTLAVNFYDRPFSHMHIAGITGTNGKTTTSYLLESILLTSGAKTGVIGTIQDRFPGHVSKATVTTPESLDLMRSLRTMADHGVTHVVMEVSSHALEQRRVKDCPFQTAVFTNFSRDHLDYHGSMEAYFQAKSLLFRDLKKRSAGGDAIAIINWDDPQGPTLGKLTDAPVVNYGLAKDCLVRAEEVRMTKAGLRARLITPQGERNIRCPLIGDFNIKGILHSYQHLN